MSSELAARYQAAMTDAGGCAIEAGLLGRLADHECHHGRLPGDPTPECGCWPTAHQATVIALDRALRAPRASTRRAA
jgi:hypothetical protein